MRIFIFPSQRKVFLFNDTILISCKYEQEKSQSQFAKQVCFYDFKLANLFLNSLEDWQGELAKDFSTFCDEGEQGEQGESLLPFLEKPFATFKNLANISKDLQEEIESILQEEIENACFNDWLGFYSNFRLVFMSEQARLQLVFPESERLEKAYTFDVPTKPTLPCFA